MHPIVGQPKICPTRKYAVMALKDLRKRLEALNRDVLPTGEPEPAAPALGSPSILLEAMFDVESDPSRPLNPPKEEAS